jgi:hypothetical protein
MVSVFAALAERLYPKRWWLAAATSAAFVLVTATIPLGVKWPVAVTIGAALAGPAIVLPWGLLCMCVWFHPTKGNLMPGSTLARLPGLIVVPIRLFFTAFLIFWLTVGAVVWPAFVLRGAWA